VVFRLRKESIKKESVKKGGAVMTGGGLYHDFVKKNNEKIKCG